MGTLAKIEQLIIKYKQYIANLENQLDGVYNEYEAGQLQSELDSYNHVVKDLETLLL